MWSRIILCGNIVEKFEKRKTYVSRKRSVLHILNSKNTLAWLLGAVTFLQFKITSFKLIDNSLVIWLWNIKSHLFQQSRNMQFIWVPKDIDIVRLVLNKEVLIYWFDSVKIKLCWDLHFPNTRFYSMDVMYIFSM